MKKKLYTGQKATIKIKRNETDWIQTDKKNMTKLRIPPYLFNLYVNIQYIKRNRLEEDEFNFKITGRNNQ